MEYWKNKKIPEVKYLLEEQIGKGKQTNHSYNISEVGVEMEVRRRSSSKHKHHAIRQDASQLRNKIGSH